MEFLNETDIESVRRIALCFLYDEPEDFGNYVGHAFISDKENNIDGKIFNVLSDTELFDKWRDKRAELINRANLSTIFCMITKNYMLDFFSEVSCYLSRIDFSRELASIYTYSEGIECDDKMIIDWFSNADKQGLMYKNEYSIYTNLPDELTVYRGIKQKEYFKRFSWTLDVEIAKQFAVRFDGIGYLCKAKIRKENIFCYLSGRMESEIVLNPNFLYDITIKKYKK